MRTARLQAAWDALQSSYWPIPSVMALAVIVLAAGVTEVDRSLGEAVPRWLGWVFIGGAEGARSTLSVIAGSVITVAGVVFSITIAALTLASLQLGPRLLRHFVRHKGSQAVLGTFIATFIYCLLVLRTVRGPDEDGFVPHLSVSIGVLLALASLGVLIYFIHHVATAIQVDTVIAEVGAELRRAVADVARQAEAHGPGAGDAAATDRAALPPGCAGEGIVVSPDASGYLQAIEERDLLDVAQERDLVIRVETRPGRFVLPGSFLARVWPEEGVTDEVAARIRAVFVVGMRRTPIQDLEFSVDQLVEVALRALSPGMNDPFTAIACIDELGAGLCRLARVPRPGPLRRDRSGRVRLLMPTVRFDSVLEAAFNQIRQSGREQVAVTTRLLETLAALARCAQSEADREAIRRHADMIAHAGREEAPERHDREAVERRRRRVQAAEEESGDRLP